MKKKATGQDTASSAERHEMLYLMRQQIDILADAEGYERVAKAAFRDLYINWDDVIRDVYKDYCIFAHS